MPEARATEGSENGHRYLGPGSDGLQHGAPARGQWRAPCRSRQPLAGQVDDAVEQGAESAYSVEEMVEKLNPPRVLWSMLPAGDVTDQMIDRFVELADEGDIIIDGANSYYKDSIRRAEKVRSEGLKWLDAASRGDLGLRGGLLHHGRGRRRRLRVRRAGLQDARAPGRLRLLGDAGAGHFAKMVHNGVEYGMMQAYAEGFEILKKSRYDYDLRAICSLWNGERGAQLAARARREGFREGRQPASHQGYVEDSGEGRWTVMEAIDEDVAANVIAASLFARIASRQEDAFALKVLAALRGQFGGHAIKEAATESEK